MYLISKLILYNFPYQAFPRTLKRELVFGFSIHKKSKASILICHKTPHHEFITINSIQDSEEMDI